MNGNGEIDLKGLLKTVATQESLKQTVSRQRKFIVFMLITVVLLFGTTLGASVWPLF